MLVLLLAAMSGASAGLTARALHLAGALHPARFESHLELGAVVVGAVAAGWVAVSCALALGCLAVRAGGRTWAVGERLVARHAPAVVRRTARIGVTVAVGTGLVLGGGTAQADEGRAEDRSAVVAVDLGWRASVPPTAPATAGPGPDAATEGAPPQTPGHPAPAPTDAPTVPAPGATGTSTPPADRSAPALPPAERDAALTVTREVPATGTEVVVLRGDTLWGIAARSLPADATDADVAAAVARWHSANVAVIGDDPDLIRPGQVLVAPSA